MGARDQETRTRLVQAAARQFAERGFEKVTVRDICRKARANVAAVNYHFGDKRGLYHAVLGHAIQIMQRTTASARIAGEGRPPAERLQAFVQIFIERVAGPGRESWIHQLMMRELADPTPALELVMTQVFVPRLDYLTEIAAELLGDAPGSERARHCAASVQSLFFAATRNPAAAPGSSGLLSGGQIDAAVAHVTRFSLAGIAGMRAQV